MLEASGACGDGDGGGSVSVTDPAKSVGPSRYTPRQFVHPVNPMKILGSAYMPNWLPLSLQA